MSLRCRLGFHKFVMLTEYWEREENWQDFEPYDIDWHYGIFKCQRCPESYHWRFL